MRSQYIVIALVIFSVGIIGCDSKYSPTSATETQGATQDAAYSIAGALGDESGGAVESFGDLLSVQSTGKINLSVTLAKGEGIETVTADSGIYNPTDGWWTITITKTRTNLRVTSSIEREYQYRFWKNDAEWQQYYIVGSDTAKKMEFKIVSGSGYFKNPIVTHQLNELHGAWLANNIDKDTVTITLQETYVRSGIDSVVTHNVTRTLNHTLSINDANLTTLRFKPSLLKPYRMWRENLPKAISGTISGHYTATITKERGDYYNETSIDKDFTVTLSGEGGDLNIGGRGGFHCDMGTGERDDHNGDHD